MGEPTDQTNRAEGFALLPMMCASGTTVGYGIVPMCKGALVLNRAFRPLIGGAFPKPHEDSSEEASGRNILSSSSSLITSCFVLLAFTIGLVFFEEVCFQHAVGPNSVYILCRPFRKIGLTPQQF